MAGVRVGDVVHFVLDGGPLQGQHRPALVTGINNANGQDLALWVFTDGGKDQDMYSRGQVFMPSVKADDSAAPAVHTWHALDDTTGPTDENKARYPGRGRSMKHE